MYRVYDKKEKQWLTDGVFIAPNDDKYKVKNGIIGNKKLELIPDFRYIYQNCIQIKDKNNKWIFEGDILKVYDPLGLNDDKVGLVSYCHEKAAYVFLCYDEMNYYPLSKGICENNSEIIGNIFETHELIPPYILENEI